MFEKVDLNKTLASLSVFSELYNSKKSIYDVIYNLILQLLSEKNIKQFSTTEIKNGLKEYYGFDNIPESVIKSSLKRKENVILKNGKYDLIATDTKKINTASLYNEALSINEKIVNDLYKYVANKNNTGLSENEKIEILQNLCDYLLNNTNSAHSKDIATYILKNEHKSDFIQELNKIKEGVFLYTGLSYSPNLDILGSWDEDLTIYLDMEILFHCIGYNGELFKEFFYDLYNLIKEINIKSMNKNNKQLIKLRYFSVTKSLIENFFHVAEKSLEKENIITEMTQAMKSILKDKKSPSEIILEKSYFFSELKRMGIEEDTMNDFYSNNDNHCFFLDENQLSTSLKENLKDVSEDKINKYTTILQYINVLRKSKHNNQFEKIGYIFLTGTRGVIATSQFIIKEGDIQLATSLDFLTNRFWFRLNKSLGKNAPKSMNVINNAKQVVGSLLSGNILNTSKVLQEQLKSKNITEEQFGEYYTETMKGLKYLPENINSENIDDVEIRISSTYLEDIHREKDKKDIEYRELKDSNLEKDTIITKLTLESTGKDKYFEYYTKSEEKKKKIKKTLKTVIFIIIVLFLLVGTILLMKYFNLYIPIKIIIYIANIVIGIIANAVLGKPIKQIYSCIKNSFFKK